MRPRGKQAAGAAPWAPAAVQAARQWRCAGIRVQQRRTVGVAVPQPLRAPPMQVRILVKRDELTLEGIKQFYVNVVSGGVAARHVQRAAPCSTMPSA